MSTSSILSKLEKCSTLQELSKLATVEDLVKAYKSYLNSKLYHAKHNAKNAQMIKAYKLEHPEIT